MATCSAALRKSNRPLFLAYAEYDPDPMRRTAENMIDTLCAKPKTCPTSIELPDHNHYTEGMAIGTDDISLTQPLLQWLARVVK